MNKSKIEWTDTTWNPITGCTKISDGCKNCYAERMSKRLAGRCGYPKDNPFQVTLHPDKLKDPLKWKKPRRVFVNSMSDLFHDDVPFEFIWAVWARMVTNRQHTYMILTKRPKRMKEFFNWNASQEFKVETTWSNIWLGVSVENQATADERIPLLFQVPATVRFVSCEPLLGPVNLERIEPRGKSAFIHSLSGTVSVPFMVLDNYPKLDWVIVGGESGPGARPMHPDWVRSLRDQCQAAGTKFFFKQFGEWIVPEDGAESCRVCGCTWNNACEGGCMWIEPGLCSNCVGKQVPDYRAVKFQRVGKKIAGRLIDGRMWDELPEIGGPKC